MGGLVNLKETALNVSTHFTSMKQFLTKTLLYTPLFICLIILLVLSGTTAVNGLFINNKGGNSLGGGIALLFTLALSGILYLQQKVAKYYRSRIKKVWFVEAIILIILIAIIVITGCEPSVG